MSQSFDITQEMDAMVSETIEKVPDENSPESASPRKVRNKIRNYLFVTSFDKRTPFGSYKPGLTNKTINVSGCELSLRNKEGDNSGHSETRSVNETNMPRPGYISDNDRFNRSFRVNKPRRDRKSKSLIPEHYFNNGVIKLKKIAREFRMSLKLLPHIPKKAPLLISKTMREPKDKVQLEKRLRTKSFSSLPNTPRVSSETLNRNDTGTLTIGITDTGCGMTNEETEKLFQPFVQANKSVHSKFGGTGLGLWLCHKLITAMKGKINCSSVLNNGTTFSLSLQLAAKHKKEVSSVNFKFYHVHSQQYSTISQLSAS